MAAAALTPAYLPEVFNRKVEDLQNPPAFDTLYPAWGDVALGAIAAVAAAIAVTGVWGAVVVFSLGTVASLIFVAAVDRAFIAVDPAYLDQTKTDSERMITALTKAHLYFVGLFNTCQFLEGVCLGEAVAAGVSLVGAFSPWVLLGGILVFGLACLVCKVKLECLAYLPQERENLAKLYDSLTRSLFGSDIPQGELQQRAATINDRSYPLSFETLKELKAIYAEVVQGNINQGDSRQFQRLENFFQSHPQYMKVCVKHLLPLMEVDAIKQLIQRHSELNDLAFLQDCKALHPSRMPDDLTTLMV